MAYTTVTRRIWADAGHCYEVTPNGDVPSTTDIRYVEVDGEPGRAVTVNVEELRLLIAALQARLPEAEKEETP